MGVDGSAGSARVEVLRRIRAANGGAADGVAARAKWEGVARGYRRSGTRVHELMLELLEDRLRDYDATVVRAAGEDVARSVAGMLAERGVKRMLVPAGLKPEWLTWGVEFVVDEGLSAAELDRFDGVMTGATLAIAETGTVVLQSVAGQGRRGVTLVPDYHLCLVRM